MLSYAFVDYNTLHHVSGSEKNFVEYGSHHEFFIVLPRNFNVNWAFVVEIEENDRNWNRSLRCQGSVKRSHY